MTPFLCRLVALSLLVSGVVPTLGQELQTGLLLDQVMSDTREDLRQRAAQGDTAAATALYKTMLVATTDPAGWPEGFSYLEQAAAAGIPEAQVRLGDLLQTGQLGTKPDLARALANYEAAANAGDNVGRRALAALLMSGQVPVDAGRSVALLEAAVAAGNIDAANLLAGYYARGYRLPADADAAIDLYALGAVSNNKSSLLGLADLYRNPSLSAHDPAKALALYQSLAEGGDANGAKRLADMMVKGEGTPVDFAAATELLESLTDRNDFTGLAAIADYHQKGIGTPVNAALAAQYFERAAEGGNRDALVRLAQLQRAGATGLPLDSSAALDNFGLAAAAGDLASRRAVAEMTARGEGTEPNLGAAVAQLEAAAAAGDSAALMMVGDFYSRGDVTAPDPEKALLYYGRAADAGLAAGLIRSAEIYRNGLPNLTADPTRAVEFYQQAIDKGDLVARRALADLLLNGAKGLTADEDTAIAMLDEAAAAGDAAAALQLGNVFSSGKPLTADYDRAMAAFDLAIAGGNANARLRKGISLMVGPLAEDHAEEGLAILQQAVTEGVAGAPLELARLQFSGQAPGASIDDAKATIEPLIAADNLSAIRFLIATYRDGIEDRLKPDPDAALALIQAKAAVLGPELVTVETNLLQLKREASLETFADIAPTLNTLRPANAIAVAMQTYSASRNGYVYILQYNLEQQGLFSGSLNGTLNNATIAAVMDFCELKGIRSECNKGPLALAVAYTLLRAVFTPA